MAEAARETQIDLSWTAPEDTNGSDVVGYRIEVSTDAGTSWTDLIADTGSTVTTYAHTGLESGASRHYRTAAINSVGTGAPLERRQAPLPTTSLRRDSSQLWSAPTATPWSCTSTNHSTSTGENAPCELLRGDR